MAKGKKKRYSKPAKPIGPIAGLTVGTGITLGGAKASYDSGGMSNALNHLGSVMLGYDFRQKTATPERLVEGWGPIGGGLAVGVVAHKVAAKARINRYLPKWLNI